MNQKTGSIAELAILEVLACGAMHGYEIARQIKSKSAGRLVFTLAALYPTLHRLEDNRQILGVWEDSEEGRRRRVYRINATGRKRLDSARQELTSLYQALSLLRR